MELDNIGNSSKFEDIVIVNGGDKDLIPIKISITELYNNTFKYFGFKPPGLPKTLTIDFNNHTDQYFRIYHKYPEKLASLEKRIRANVKSKLRKEGAARKEFTIINRFWDEIYNNPELYKEEINYIRRIWYFRLFGYWFMNNGVPTYMTGANFIYLYFYRMRTGELPKYRDRDRRWFIFQQFTRLDTKTFKKRDKDGWAIPEKDGAYQMVDIGRRVAYGNITSKPRRVGDTSKAGLDVIEEATRSVEGQFGNQAMDDTSAERVFLHYINTPFNKFPLILKPVQERINPANNLMFDSSDPEIGLGSWIDYATTKHRSAYDGTFLRKYYADEAGKVRYESIKARHATVKLCLSERDLIIGNCLYTTTVEEMEDGAADEFMALSKDSMYHQRKDNGQTPSGLYVCFFPADDGHPSFIDKYGMSVVETPIKEQAKFIKQFIGAKEYLLNQRKILKGEALALEKRQNPLTYRECFSPDPKNQLFHNIDEMLSRITDLKFDADQYRIGNLSWETERFGRVKWEDNREYGKFVLSKHFNIHELNQWSLKDGLKYPKILGKYVGCGDPFRLEKTDSSRMSKGGFAAFWLRDYDVDPENTEDKNLKSERFFIDYLEKPETMDLFVEDLLMACIYFGIMMYPENNINIISEKFIEWGFEGYLLYDYNSYTGEHKNNAGFNASATKKADMFNMGRDHFKKHVNRELHYRIIEQAIDLRGLEDLKNKDLLTASLGCFLGAKSHYQQYLKDDAFTKGMDTSGWVPTYNY